MPDPHPPADWQPELRLALATVRAAAALVREHYQRPGLGVYEKADHTPLTDADLAADRLIRERVAAAFPADALLTEETADDPGRLANRRVWVADREADIYDLFAQPRPPGHDLLVRSAHDRRVAGAAGTLRAAAAAAPGGEVVPVPVGRSGEREPREALVVVRWRAVAVQPPRHHRRRARCAPVPATVVTAEEPAPPPGEGPVRWRLLTTLPVADGAAALWCVRAYARRWLVERYHYTLKQGCRVEALQLRTTARLERALAVLAVAAWRLLWLACLARAAPDLPCTVALADDAWPVLWRSAAPGAPLPTRPPPLAEAARLLARLGGFQDRAGDGPPGVVVLWRGLRRLDDLALGWHLATSPPTCG